MKNISTTFILFISITSLFIFSCSKVASEAETDLQETAQQIGDVMASIDEAGGSSGNINTASVKNSVEKTFARYAPNEMSEDILSQMILPKANAATCDGAGFAACSTNTMVRTFNGCTVGTATFSGDVTLTWSNVAACSMQVNGETVRRAPNFTVTGRRGATLSVTKSGTDGQELTRTGAGAFSFRNDGINRKFVTADSITLFDHTTSTTSNITITGASRVGRVMNGGSLRVRNNLTNVTCDYVPSSVTWNNTCNCPISGSWSGSCSTGKATNLTITGCGTANYTEGTTSELLVFDRCGS